MLTVSQREAARRDLEHFVYLAENANMGVADRFLRSAESSSADLAQQPMMGSPLALKHPELAHIRKWWVVDGGWRVSTTT